MNWKISSSLLNIEEASKLLHVHPNTLRNWDEKNILKSVRFGSRKDRHYRREDLERFMQSEQIKNVSTHKDMFVQEQFVALQKLFYTSLDFMQTPPDKVYESIIKKAQEFTDAEYGSIFMPENGRLKRTFATDDIIYTVRQPRKIGKVSMAFYTRKSYTYPIRCPEDTEPGFETLGVRSLIFIPLSYKDKTVGVINMLSKKSSVLSDTTHRMLDFYGSLASVVINKENKKLI